VANIESQKIPRRGNVQLTELSGVIIPMVTPLLAGETIDLEGTRLVVEHLLEGGVDGLFLLGSTGEFCGLRDKEKDRFLSEVTGVVNGRVAVLAGVSEPGTERTLNRIAAAAEAQVDAVVVTPPYYFPLSQQSVIDHFEYLAEHSPLPIVLYNIPLTTGVFITAKTIAQLISSKAITMVKDSSGDFLHFQDLLSRVAPYDTCRVFQGHEGLACASLAMGADGLVPACGNIAPKLYVSLFEAVRRKRMAEAISIQQLVTQLIGIYAYGSVYGAIKVALRDLGLCRDELTRPLAHPSLEEEQEIRTRVGLVKEKGYL